ncbi:MAG: 30S ribosomal protein S15 [Spirochaetes bacterium]|nr:30S ribosomal protein S15 [Spirochaetota bacterium]
MITTEQKKQIFEQYGREKNDTGSPEVQIAMLTERVKYLTEHLKAHKKDFHSRRGLLILVGRRRRFLDYLKRINLDKYRTLIQDLGIRK